MTLNKPYTKQEYIDFIAWCNQNNCHPVATDDGYTAEENPAVEVEETATEMDKISAQVMYTALMTDTLLDEESEEE